MASRLPQSFYGAGTPEASVTASTGAIYWDTTNNVFYFKESGLNTNTGWIAHTTSSGAATLYGAGTPEGSQTAAVGTIYWDTTNNIFYFKETGSGNTGWTAHSSSSSTLDGLADVTNSAPAGSHIIAYNSNTGTYRNRLDNFFNVLDYGVYNDDTNGPTNKTRIQNALDACDIAGGGIVYFPAGMYKTDGPLYIGSQTVVMGAGWGNDVTTTFPVVAYKNGSAGAWNTLTGMDRRGTVIKLTSNSNLFELKTYNSDSIDPASWVTTTITTATNHGFTDNDVVRFSTIGNLVTSPQINTTTNYYVDRLTDTTFRLTTDQALTSPITYTSGTSTTAQLGLVWHGTACQIENMTLSSVGNIGVFADRRRAVYFDNSEKTTRPYSPDSIHRIHNVKFMYWGGEAIHFTGAADGDADQSSRDNRVTECDFQNCGRAGYSSILYESSSDGYINGCVVASSGPDGIYNGTNGFNANCSGIIMDGGSGKIFNTKTTFNDGHGIWIKSSRCFVGNCEAQDDSGDGIYVDSVDAFIVGFKADSCGKASGSGTTHNGYAVYINADKCYALGIHAHDRGASAYRNMEYCIGLGGVTGCVVEAGYGTVNTGFTSNTTFGANRVKDLTTGVSGVHQTLTGLSMTANASASSIDCSHTAPGTLNLASTATAEPEIIIRNSGAQTITVDPSGGETINGSATYALAANGGVWLKKLGSNWYAK